MDCQLVNFIEKNLLLMKVNDARYQENIDR